MVEKIQTGIYGLDSLIDGGIIRNSVGVVTGYAGTGKTTLGLQFLRKGVREGHDGIYITLEQTQKDILLTASEMGWDLQPYLDNNKLAFIELGGAEFSEFIKGDLPRFVSEWEGANARIVVDTLTPIMWSSPDKYAQRELISMLFNETKKMGTVLATLEEISTASEDRVIPVYLCDALFRFENTTGEFMEENRTMRVVKCRNSWHSRLAHPYRILRGMGVVIQSSVEEKMLVSMPENLEERLRQLILPLPREERKEIEKTLNIVLHEDVGQMELDYLLQFILDDYDLKVNEED